MTLIGESTPNGDVRQGRIRVQQLLLGALDTNFEQPLVRRRSERLPERAREMTRG
jgi:hypothetical protein